MNVRRLQKSVFRRGSKTYFNSSVFFPPAVKRDVYALYAFVRVADDFVDTIPQDANGFYSFRRKYEHALMTGSPSDDPIIDAYIELATRRDFDPAWTTAFLHSMELDLTKKVYASVDETLEYVYGSAEVIGLFMSKILQLPEEALPAACMQGRAMQFINFIRDIDEDVTFGRQYLPASETSLTNLSEEATRAQPDEFRRFLKLQIERYLGWQKQAETGYRFMERRYFIPVKTASDMYNWTATRIINDPFVVYQKKVKPAKARIYWTILANALFS